MEMGLVLGTPLRVLAARFEVSPYGLHNHRHKHLSPAQAAAYLSAVKPSKVDLETLQRQESEGLLGSLVGQRARLQQLVELSMELNDVGRAVAAERAITDNLALVAKLLGQLVQHHEVRHTNILISADYIALRTCLVQALRPFPEAALAVGKALHKLESEAALEISERKVPLVLEASPSC